MSLFLSKLLSLFIHPLTLGLLVVGAGLGVSYGRRRLGRAIIAGGVLVVAGPATPWAADGLQGTLEARHPPTRAAATPTADAIVVLGGAVGAPQPPRVYPDLGGAADRVWHAARLYKADRAPFIIASGGTLPWANQAFREAPAMARLLTSWGVPRDSIVTESNSANTYENARNTAKIVQERGLDRVLLVTSALHMRRALATFRGAGVSAIPAATDHQVVDAPMTALDFIPSAGALARSTAAIREYVGYIVYDWRGWIAERPASHTAPSARVCLEGSDESAGSISSSPHTDRRFHILAWT